jgi:hypothetical protein
MLYTPHAGYLMPPVINLISSSMLTVSQSQRKLLPSQNSQLTLPLRRRLLLNLPHHILLQSLRLTNTPPPLHHLSVPPNQKFLKIPLHPLQPQHPRFLPFHPLKYWLGLITIHIGLPQDGKGNAVVELAELLDLVIRARILAVELVAGEAEDDELVRVSGLHVLV